MSKWDDPAVVPSIEHLEKIADDHDPGAWAGVVCSHGCRGPVACEHVAHLVDAIERGEAR